MNRRIIFSGAALLSVIVLVIYFAARDRDDRRPSDLVETRLRGLHQMIVDRESELGRPIATCSELRALIDARIPVKSARKILYADPWGTAFVCKETIGRDGVRLDYYSAGRNKIDEAGKDDDIVMQR